MATEEPQLPSYNEALEWGIAPPPRPQWAPPREAPSSPRPRTAWPRAAAYRALSMSTIDETLSGAGSRPQTAAGRTASGRPLSLLDIGLDAILADALSRDNLPTRPSTSQGFRSAASSRNSTSSRIAPFATRGGDNNHQNNSNSSSSNNSSNNNSRPPTPLADPPMSPAYTVVPDPLPLHVRPLVPPTYARHDPIARTYLMRSPLVYTSTGSSPQTPAYHLEASGIGAGALGQGSGRPNQLRIRQLDHIESRTLSLSRDDQGRGGGGRGSLEYDDDHTLYLLQVMQLLGGFAVPGLGPSWRVEMQRDPKGDSGGRNSGFIRFEGGGLLGTGKGFMQRSACKFWYMTKKTEVALRTPHEWKLINKYGWQPELEWNKRLMFTVEKKRAVVGRKRGYEWRDGKGRLVAFESAEGRLDLTGIAASMSAQSREALLACWVGKSWAAGALTW